MYYCYECEKTFEYPKIVAESRGEYWGFPAYENMAYCPHCGEDCFLEYDEYLKEIKEERTFTATCSCCGYSEDYEMDEDEYETYNKYIRSVKPIGLIQDLFPYVPAWIRQGAIDKHSDGFCICPKCCG